MVNEQANDGWARQPGDQVADTDGLAAERDPLREVDAPRAAWEARIAAMASDPPLDTGSPSEPASGQPGAGTGRVQLLDALERAEATSVMRQGHDKERNQP